MDNGKTRLADVDFPETCWLEAIATALYVKKLCSLYIQREWNPIKAPM